MEYKQATNRHIDPENWRMLIELKEKLPPKQLAEATCQINEFFVQSLKKTMSESEYKAGYAEHCLDVAHSIYGRAIGILALVILAETAIIAWLILR